jgi:transposase
VPHRVTPATSASLAPIHVSGYLGLGMITPIRKPPHRELLDWEKEFNTAINKIRWRIEQTIANLKTWRILHTDYRRPLASFAETMRLIHGRLVDSRRRGA